MANSPTAHYCSHCQDVTETAHDQFGDHRCLTCGRMIWIPIAWNYDGYPCGWSTRCTFTNWQNVPPEDKLICYSCGFSWLLVSDTGYCPACNILNHKD